MAYVKSHTFTDGTKALAGEVNVNFDNTFSAINEINGKVGTVTELVTTAKDNLVDAVNEVAESYIKRDGSVDYTAVHSYPKLTITAITKANPAVVTIADHTFVNGDKIYINSVVGMTEINGQTYIVANKADDTVELSGVDSSSYTAYSSGGNAYLLPKDDENLANQIYVTDQISKVIPWKGYLYGLKCTNGIEGALQDILIGVGECVDSTGTKLMKITSPIQKRLWESWTKGTNKGGRASGVSLTNATWYHTFIIADDYGNVDAGQDTDINATNLLATSGYTYFRRIRPDVTLPASVTLTGTVAVTSGSATITGSGTTFTKDLMAGNSIVINGVSKVILSVTSDTVATATTNFSSSASGQAINLSSSPNLRPLNQDGDLFTFSPLVQDFNGTPPGSYTDLVLTAPPNSLVKLWFDNNGGNNSAYIKSDITGSVINVIAGSNNSIYHNTLICDIKVDNNSKIKYMGSGTITIQTLSFTYTRGK